MVALVLGYILPLCATMVLIMIIGIILTRGVAIGAKGTAAPPPNDVRVGVRASLTSAIKSIH